MGPLNPEHGRHTEGRMAAQKTRARDGDVLADELGPVAAKPPALPGTGWRAHGMDRARLIVEDAWLYNRFLLTGALPGRKPWTGIP